MEALIIDNEQSSRAALRNTIAKYCDSILQIKEAVNIEMAVDIIKQKTPDIVLLDIEMAGENGLSLFNHFPDFSFKVIFVTACKEHALKAFDFAAVDYILKPHPVKRLVRSIERAIFSLKKQNIVKLNPLPNNRLAIPTINGFKIINIEEVLYCQAERNYTIFFLEGGEKIMASKNLGKFESLLNETTFLRIHRSFIVNFNKIRQFRKGKTPIIILSDCTQLDVSIHKKEALLDRLQIVA